jgi:hypothetical protein
MHSSQRSVSDGDPALTGGAGARLSAGLTRFAYESIASPGAGTWPLRSISKIVSGM